MMDPQGSTRPPTLGVNFPARADTHHTEPTSTRALHCVQYKTHRTKGLFVRSTEREAQSVKMAAWTGSPVSRLVGAASLRRYNLTSETRCMQPTFVRQPLQWGERRIGMEGTNRRLMWHGMCLFLLGLLTGFAETHFTNMRMGVAAHLEGVMNGTFLVALGAAWTQVRLPGPPKAIAYWTALYGTYGNWLVTTLAAIFRTAALSPFPGPGHSERS